MKRFLAFLFVLVALTSCTDYVDAPGVSVWGKGNWILFWLPFIGGAVLSYFGYKRSVEKGHKWYNDSQLRIGAIIIAVALFIVVPSVLSSR